MMDLWLPPGVRGYRPAGSSSAPRDVFLDAQEVLLKSAGLKLRVPNALELLRHRRGSVDAAAESRRRDLIRVSEAVTATLLNVTAFITFNVAVYPTALMRVYFETFPKEVMPLGEWLTMLRSRSRCPGFYRSVYGGTATSVVSMYVAATVLRTVVGRPQVRRSRGRGHSIEAIGILLLYNTAQNLVCYLCTFDIALRSRHQILRFLHDPSSAGAPTPSSLFIGASPSLLTGPGAWLLLVHGLVTSFTRAAVYVASDELEYALLLERPHVATRHCRRAHLLTKSILAPQVVLEVLMLPFLSVANRMFGQYLGLSSTSYTGMLDCAASVWRDEGVRGFLRSPVAIVVDISLAVAYLAASGAAAAFFEYVQPSP